MNSEPGRALTLFFSSRCSFESILGQKQTLDHPSINFHFLHTHNTVHNIFGKMTFPRRMLAVGVHETSVIILEDFGTDRKESKKVLQGHEEEETDKQNL